MIEIIIGEVEMPELDQRRFQKKPKDCNGRRWHVTDNGKIVYTGKFDRASLICHNLNKKHYRK